MADSSQGFFSITKPYPVDLTLIEISSTANTWKFIKHKLHRY